MILHHTVLIFTAMVHTGQQTFVLTPVKELVSNPADRSRVWLYRWQDT